MQTDTLNPYPINDSSAFYIWIDTITDGWTNNTFSIKWMQNIDVDTLKDFCIIQFTDDSGITWVNLKSSSKYYWQWYKGTNTNYNNTYLSGNSYGWQSASICITFIGLKKNINQNFGFRFMLKTDSVNTVHSGWAIKDIKVYNPSFTSNINEYSKYHLQISPNPTTQFITIHNSNYPITSYKIVDAIGNIILKEQLPNHTNNYQINLQHLPNGIYFLQSTVNGFLIVDKFIKE